MEEIWKPVVGYEGKYEVSSLGRVRSVDRMSLLKNRWGGTMLRHYKGRVIKRGRHNQDYALMSFGHSDKRLLHHVVAEAFIGPRPRGLMVLHRDGNKQNCAANNLYYGTGQDNHADAVVHGSVSYNGRRKICPVMYLVIADMYKSGLWTQQQIAKLYGITHSMVSYIVRRKWAHRTKAYALCK